MGGDPCVNPILHPLKSGKPVSGRKDSDAEGDVNREVDRTCSAYALATTERPRGSSSLVFGQLKTLLDPCLLEWVHAHTVMPVELLDPSDCSGTEATLSVEDEID